MLHTIRSTPARTAESQAYPEAQRRFPPSRFAAWRRALSADAGAYARSRNHLAGAVTALSPYLTHGVLGEDELIALWRERQGMTLDDKLVMELAWRAFFHDVWSRHGNGILADMGRPAFPGVRYQASLPEDILHASTGVPVIDSTVRRLYSDGYLHNHQRMWLASYCVHLRKVAWRAGADWMYGHLLDGDLASNHLSWQWVAGTFSTKPYLFNADNVARFAPHLASPGTALDCDYEALAEIAASNTDVGPQAGRRPAGVDAPRLLARPPRILPPTDFERLVRGRAVALLHPWDLSARPAADCVIGVFHQPYHNRFPWSEKRWDFVLKRMVSLCDAVWTGDLAQLGRILERASRVHAREALQPGYASALSLPPIRLAERRQWLPPAPHDTRSFSAFMRFLRRDAPELFSGKAVTRSLHLPTQLPGIPLSNDNRSSP
jgi:deoxyribodipyrimidine photo-lyase